MYRLGKMTGEIRDPPDNRGRGPDAIGVNAGEATLVVVVIVVVVVATLVSELTGNYNTVRSETAKSVAEGQKWMAHTCQVYDDDNDDDDDDEDCE